MSQYQSRKSRGKSQKLFLVHSHDNKEQYEKCYDIMGTTGNVYTVSIKNIPECTCPDHQTRNKRCKHIYFVLLRIMKVSEDQEDNNYSNEDLTSMFNKIPNIAKNCMVEANVQNKYHNLKIADDKKSINVGQQSLDDMCPICLDDLKNGEDVNYCKFSCGKNIHVQCFQMWCKKQPKELCVYCRNPWNKTADSCKYINLTT